MWQVIVVEKETMQTVEAFKPVHDFHTAERIQRGVMINLNEEKYFVDLVYLGELF